jgi:hypothetical protein
VKHFKKNAIQFHQMADPGHRFIESPRFRQKQDNTESTMSKQKPGNALTGKSKSEGETISQGASALGHNKPGAGKAGFDADFAKGGAAGQMFGKQNASKAKPGTSAADKANDNKGHFAKGGTTSMHGYVPSEPAKGGQSAPSGKKGSK